MGLAVVFLASLAGRRCPDAVLFSSQKRPTRHLARRLEGLLKDATKIAGLKLGVPPRTCVKMGLAVLFDSFVSPVL